MLQEIKFMFFVQIQIQKAQESAKTKQHYVKAYAGMLVEPTCAICTVGSYSLLSVCLSVLWTRPKVEKIIHISISFVDRGMKFGHIMDVDDPK